MIHLQIDDENEEYSLYESPLFNKATDSFQILSREFNRALKKINQYSSLSDAKYVGYATPFPFGATPKKAIPFYITVWETINKLSEVHIQHTKNQNNILIGMSDQISNLYLKEGIRCETLHVGCDTDFWRPTQEKHKKFTFLFSGDTSIRSGLDLSVEAFHLAFQSNQNVQLVIKITKNNQNALLTKINEYKLKGSNIHTLCGFFNRGEMRDLYSSCHVGLNVLRMASWGLPLHEMSACGCLVITGDAAPTNVVIEKDYGILLKPKKEIPIHPKAYELKSSWGLINYCEGIPYSEPPMFYDFNVEEYAELLKNIYTNWSSYQKIDTRSPIVKRWKWANAAENLVKILQKYELAS